MSTEGNSRHTKMLKRTQTERNTSSTYTYSSSDEDLTQRKRKLLQNSDLPGSSGKASGERKCTKKNRFRASQKKITTVSVGMHDLEKFSKSLIEDLKVESKKMLAQFEKDLRNVTASNSTGNTTNNRGGLNTSQARSSQAPVQLNPHSEPQQGQPMISSSTRSFIPPAGQQIQGSVFARPSSNQNASLMGYGNLSTLHGNNIHTSGMVPGFLQPTLDQSLGNTFHIPNQTLAGNSSGGVDTLGWNMNRAPAMFSGSSHAVSNSVLTNNFRANDFYSNANLGADEGRLPMYGFFQ
ncbi:hypothetical protein ACET3Z_008484 [Daucus carota]